MRKVETVELSENNFKSSIMQTLQENVVGDKEVMMVMLHEKLGSFEDPIEKSPVFVFGSEKVTEAKEIIKEWVDRIDSVHYFLPKLTIQYFFAILREEEFDAFLAGLDQIPKEWGNLVIAVRKYKEAISQLS